MNSAERKLALSSEGVRALDDLSRSDIRDGVSARASGRDPLAWAIRLSPVLAAVITFSASLAIGGHGAKPHATAAPPLAASATQARVSGVPIAMEAIGAAQARQGAVIRTQINGRLKEVAAEKERK